MTDTGFIYRASWPITDLDRPLSALKAEACRDIDAMAQLTGCRIVGAITWTVAGERLIAQAPALPTVEQAGGRAAWGSVKKQAEYIETMAARGMSDPTIAKLLGCSADTVRGIRHPTTARAA